MFICCFSQVQQVILVKKKLEDLKVVFIDMHSKLQKVWIQIQKFRSLTGKPKTLI